MISAITRVDSCTYSIGGGFFVEKMVDGTWTAYKPVDEADRYIWTWSSRKHPTRRSARSAAKMHQRLSSRMQ